MFFIKESEIVAQKICITKVFLKISQSSKENISVRVNFVIKLQDGGLQLH